MTAGITTQLRVIPSGAALGARLEGIDLTRDVDDPTVAAISDAWREHLVLLIRGQAISDAQLIDFSSRFGELDPPGPNPSGQPYHRDHPELNVISNIVADGRPIGNLGAGEAVWHADMTYIETPPKAAILYAIEVPPTGGNTYFANMYAAYEALPERLKRAIEGRIAVHDASHNSAGMRRKGYPKVTDVRRTPGARHSLVRTDPETGRKGLFLGRRPRAYIIGMPVAESEALLDEIWAHAGDMRFGRGHQWQAGDLLMWNNLAVLHRRDAFDPNARRRLHRAQLRGDQAIR